MYVEAPTLQTAREVFTAIARLSAKWAQPQPEFDWNLYEPEADRIELTQGWHNEKERIAT
jgi:hypothetical protein